ncbi:hypothetical protein LEL_09750 [Akanthomyces lecanii RCEF 1005]|uniref:Uncharacterized protein n=1 Tax=Akanthomyces lecanii RCEF 1005 TaxID=1081108 RepID=A0A162LFJ4_CORDF|nr:hypothetical protein LEL_09750 [Akanthomyces lecanii RCEF 1005]
MFLNSATPRRSPSLSSMASAESSWSDLDETNPDTSNTFAAGVGAVDLANCHRCPSPECPLLRDRQNSTSSVRSCEDMSVDKTQELWFCMLELQERYGCYTSTRIDLALDAGEEAINFMPNRFIIDTLNNSLRDLPDEGWNKLYQCLDHQASTEKSKPKRKFWSKA